jgi:hypothetical protein
MPTDPLVFLFGVGATLGFGIAPRPAVGTAADVGLRWPFDAAPIDGFSLSLGVRWDPPAAAAVPGDATGARVVTSRLLATVAPCGHWWKLYGCALGELGHIGGTGENLVQPLTGGRFYADLGGRLGVEVPFASHLAFRGYGEVLGLLTGATVTINARPAWATPNVSGGIGAGLVIFF